jgi:hypothetical protein
MLFYDWTGNTLAERQGSNNFHIRYLIDETGKLFKPEPNGSEYYDIVDQGFGADSEINYTLYNASYAYEQSSKPATIHRPLKQYYPIVYTDSGSMGTNYLQKNGQITPYIGFTSPSQSLSTFTPIYVTTNNIFTTNNTTAELTLTSSNTNFIKTIVSGSYIEDNYNVGYGNCLDISIKQYDQIRFNADESTTRYIVSSSLNSFGNLLYLFLNEPINTDLTTSNFIDVNVFLIRRLVDDPGFVIINTQNAQGPGFILPKYPSPTLKSNFSNIVQDLASKNLLL